MLAADNEAGGESVAAGFRRQTRVRKAARLVLTERFEAMWARLDAALAGEAELGIHQMRVAAKQLREAMRLFRPCYRPGAFQRSLDELESLNDLLGVVRDADVLVENADSVFKKPSAVVDHLKAGVTDQREHDQAALIATLTALSCSGFADRFHALCVTGRRERTDKFGRQTLGEFAPLAVGERLRRVCKRLRAVTGEDDAAGLHAVRVANKLLRYTMEVFLGVYDRRFADAYLRVVELHKALGDLHDLDVLRERLLAELPDPTEPEAAKLLDRLAARREREYGRVMAFVDQESMLVFARQINNSIG